MSYSIHPKLSTIPSDLVSLDDYEKLAKNFMPQPVYEYIRSGGADEKTLERNRTAYAEVQLYNRILTNSDQATTRIQLLGQHFRHPILLAPVAHQQLVHEDAELATAEAAEAMEAGFITSTLASKSLEDIAAKTEQPKWFQLYFQADKDQTLALVRRAEQAGYSALVVTLDVPINGLRNNIQRSGFQLPASAQMINQQSSQAAPISLSPEQSIIFQGFMSEAPHWQDIQWLRDHTQLPILLKGITHPLDAKQAITFGADGIVVSNHGGRGLDTLPATIDALPAIRQAVGDDTAVLLDGGIRRGTDVFKALALGANAICIGRPQVYALAVAGALGVAHSLKILRDELEVTMALCGCPTPADITTSCIF